MAVAECQGDGRSLITRVMGLLTGLVVMLECPRLVFTPLSKAAKRPPPRQVDKVEERALWRPGRRGVCRGLTHAN